MICDIWLSYSISFSPSFRRSVYALRPVFVSLLVVRDNIKNTYNMGAEMKMSVIKAHLGECWTRAQTHTHTNRGTLVVYVRSWVAYVVFSYFVHCVYEFLARAYNFFIQFNLLFYLLPFPFLSLSPTLWLHLVIGHCIQMMTTISCCCFLLLCIYLTLSFLLCVCCAHTHTVLSLFPVSLWLCATNFFSLIWCAHFLCCCIFRSGCKQCVCV